MYVQYFEILFLLTAIAIGIYTVVFTIKTNNIKSDLKILKKELEFKDKEIASQAIKLEKKETELVISQARLEKAQDKLERELQRVDDEMDAMRLKRKEFERQVEAFDDEKMTKIKELSNLSTDEAKEVLIDRVKQENETFIAEYLKNFEQKLLVDKNEIAQKLIINTMESIAVDLTNEVVIKPIKLENESLKGRLIGREGRNIRLLETLLGVNIIIDDTPNTIFVSCFNARRRAIAQITLETLINTGRINQATIEQEAAKSITKADDLALSKGKEVVYQFGINDMQAEVIMEIGNMHFRSSYGQNLLHHTIEAANIAYHIAGELGLDQSLAARCVLLHDIGKNKSAELGESHVKLGVKLARTHGESEIVVNAIEAHHNDVEPTSIYAVLTVVADSMSAGREGARRDQFENFINRVENLEKIATVHPGVTSAYALQGGRELRVVVNSNLVSDDQIKILAHEIKMEIQESLMFPGIIDVIVIREAKAIEHAAKDNIGV